MRRGDDVRYTRDASGQLRRKDHPLIEAYGALDELVCSLGWLSLALPATRREMVARWQAWVGQAVGSLGHRVPWPEVLASLEGDIGALGPVVPRRFVTPGANEASCRAHLARATCRRAERRAISAGAHEGLITFLNRLSWALFVLAVSLCHEACSPTA